MFYARRPLKTDEVSAIKLAVVIKRAISFLEYQLKQDDIEIIVNIENNTYLISGNSNELEQVVTNIILNAKDAIKKVKDSGNIYISAYKKDEWIILEIKDDGAGIDEETLSKIFDPFFTTKDVGKGLGLGLSICQAIVKRYNGTINAQSEAGKGTIFTIKFPSLEEKAGDYQKENKNINVH